MAVTRTTEAVWQSECQCENQTASEIMRVRLGLGVTGQVSPTLGVPAFAFENLVAVPSQSRITQYGAVSVRTKLPGDLKHKKRSIASPGASGSPVAAEMPMRRPRGLPARAWDVVVRGRRVLITCRSADGRQALPMG